MKTINKYYILNSSRLTTLQMPHEAKILNYRLEDDSIVIWVLENTDLDKYDRTFEVIRTGWEVSDNMRYIGTCHDSLGAAHVMEIA